MTQAGRKADPVPVYVSFMEQLDLRRRELKWTCWKLDDASGLQDGYSPKPCTPMHHPADKRDGGCWIIFSLRSIHAACA
jgi:hypothetical protein